MGILMARAMGADQYGLFSLADTAFYVVVGLAMLGLPLALIRYIPVFVNRRDEKAIFGTLQVGIGLPFIISILAGIGLWFAAERVAVMVFNEPRLEPVLLVVAVALPFGALISATSAALRGFNQIKYGVIGEDIFLSFIKLILVIGLVFTGLNAVKSMTAHAIGTAVTCILLFFFLHKLFPLNRPWRSAHYNSKELVKFSIPLYGSDLLSLLGGNLQTLLLGMFNTVASVGIFTVATRVNLIGTMIYSSFNTSAEPIVSELHSKEEYQQLGHFYQSVTKWTFSSNLPLFLIILLFPKLILSIFGEDFTTGSLALIILSGGSLIDAGTGINAAVITMTGKSWLNIINTVIWLTLQLALSFLLIPGWGVVGAAIAVAGSRAAINVARTLEVFILYRLLPYNRSFFKPILAGFLAVIVGYVTANWVFRAGNLVGAVIGMGLLLVTYAGTILLLGLSNEDRLVLERVFARFEQIPGLSRFKWR